MNVPDETPGDVASLTSPTSLENIVATLAEIVGNAEADIAVADASGSRIVVATDADLAVQLASAAVSPTTDALSTGRIARFGTTLALDAYVEYRTVCDRLRVHSVAAFPIVADGVVHGVITVTSTDHHAFGATEIRAARAATEQALPLLVSALSA